jgi:putative endonuclease
MTAALEMTAALGSASSGCRPGNAGAASSGMPSRIYSVYIHASRSRRLYIGVTNDLVRRVFQHRSGRPGSFTRRYRITRLVYFEQGTDIRGAIAREKQLKGWTREKKLRLIESVNAGWLDLAGDWFPAMMPTIPAPASSRAERGIWSGDGSGPDG